MQNTQKKNFSKVFLIAGSEPLGSAGLQADIKAVSACGGFAAGAVTCIVDEDTLRVKEIHTLPVRLIVNQARSFLEDVGAECIKTGMLYSAELIEGVGALLRDFPQVPKVIDPVMVSSAGFQLLRDDAVQAYASCLFPQAAIITPNCREADILLGHHFGEKDVEADLRELAGWGNAVIVKSVSHGEQLADYLYLPGPDRVRTFVKERIETHNVNGTGDTFASAIATYLARGYGMEQAVERAEIFIGHSITFGAEYSFGSGYGPVHPFFRNRAFFMEEDRVYGRPVPEDADRG